MEEALSVSRFLQRIKNAVVQAFRGAFWIEGEVQNVRQFKASQYITLVEHGGGYRSSDVKCDVVAYPDVLRAMNAQLAAANIRLTAGLVVRVYGEVQLSKTGTAQIKMLRLDTDALIGNKAIERKAILTALTNEGLLRANAQLPTPLVPLRVALVTSENSEGHKDFIGQLERSEFAFCVQLIHSQVQGPNAISQLTNAISSVNAADADIICVVRGGGGELDAFDKEPVARAIANAAVPVWVGVGHTGDRSIADEVASQSFITPTECGQGVVRAVSDFAQRVQNLSQRSSNVANRSVDNCASQLGFLQRALARGAQQSVAVAQNSLNYSSTHLQRNAQRAFETASNNLAARRRHLEALNPTAPLRRGYSITRDSNGATIASAAQLASGKTIETLFFDGTVTSTVDSIDQKSDPRQNKTSTNNKKA